jgi:vacuolar protein sorting-associated protein 54
MDVAEVHLINSISAAATTFLLALNSLSELSSEVADLVENIKALRKNLALLDEGMVTSVL